jgi:hypothetical protein
LFWGSHVRGIADPHSEASVAGSRLQSKARNNQTRGCSACESTRADRPTSAPVPGFELVRIRGRARRPGQNRGHGRPIRDPHTGACSRPARQSPSTATVLLAPSSPIPLPLSGHPEAYSTARESVFGHQGRRSGSNSGARQLLEPIAELRRQPARHQPRVRPY